MPAARSVGEAARRFSHANRAVHRGRCGRYWPARFARGGRATVPDAPGHPTQIVDVRDLAEWIVRCGEERLTGTFDAVGPRRRLAEVLTEVAAATGAPELSLVPQSPDALTAVGVQHWSGPRSLPLWLPESHWGFADRDPAPAAAASLRTRSIADTARAALEHERALGADQPCRGNRSALTRSSPRDMVTYRGIRPVPNSDM